MQINTFLLITSQKYMYNTHISANSKTLLYKKEKLIFLLKNCFIYYLLYLHDCHNLMGFMKLFPQQAHQYQNLNLIISASSHSQRLI